VSLRQAAQYANHVTPIAQHPHRHSSHAATVDATAKGDRLHAHGARGGDRFGADDAAQAGDGGGAAGGVDEGYCGVFIG
jgi:hypothetical protein